MAEEKSDFAARIEVAKPGDIIILSKDEIDQFREMSKWWSIVGNELHDMGQEDARLWRQWLAFYGKLKGVADLGGVLGSEWLREVEALSRVAAEVLDPFELLEGFDSLDDDLHPEGMTEAHDRRDERR